MKQLLTLLTVVCLFVGGVSSQSKTNLDINKATAAEIAATLEGIGPKKAAAIVAYRKKNGALKTTDDLLQVPGLGPVLVAKNVKAFGLKRGVQPLAASSKRGPKKAAKPAGAGASKSTSKPAKAALDKAKPAADAAKKGAAKKGVTKKGTAKAGAAKAKQPAKKPAAEKGGAAKTGKAKKGKAKAGKAKAAPKKAKKKAGKKKTAKN
ncbi:MAG: ComEA family DNA-binding protein [Planctomycetota bacterium]